MSLNQKLFSACDKERYAKHLNFIKMQTLCKSDVFITQLNTYMLYKVLWNAIPRTNIHNVGNLFNSPRLQNGALLNKQPACIYNNLNINYDCNFEFNVFLSKHFAYWLYAQFLSIRLWENLVTRSSTTTIGGCYIIVCFWSEQAFVRCPWALKAEWSGHY